MAGCAQGIEPLLPLVPFVVSLVGSGGRQSIRRAGGGSVGGRSGIAREITGSHRRARGRRRVCLHATRPERRQGVSPLVTLTSAASLKDEPPAVATYVA